MTRLTETHSTIDQAIGARLRTLRKQVGISQTTLADAIGVTFQQVQKYEKGTNRVAVSTLIAICRTLGVGTADVIASVAGEEPSAEGSVRVRMADQIATLQHQHQAIRAILDGKPSSDLRAIPRAAATESAITTVQ